MDSAAGARLFSAHHAVVHPVAAVGLETLAATVGEEAITIEDVYEPYLMQIGFISRTPRGRQVTRLAYEHLGLSQRKDDTQINIFDEEK